MPENRSSSPDLAWVLIAGGAFLAAMVAAAVFIAFADRLSFISNAVYYMMLMPLALGSAAFLFGAMRSHAKYKGVHPSGTLQLGGPVVVFTMILLGGILVANPESTSRLTVRLTDSVDPTAMITRGEVFVDIGDDRRMGAVGPNGQVTFTEIPRNFLTGELNVIPRVERYRPVSAGPYSVGPGGIIDVRLARIPDTTRVVGTVANREGPVGGVLVNFNHGAAVGTTDDNGNFRIDVPVDEGIVVPVTVTINGRRIHSDDYVVSSQTGLAILVESPP